MNLHEYQAKELLAGINDAETCACGVAERTFLVRLGASCSTPVGVQLLKDAADNVLRTSMELGGNAPFLVFEDADLDAAVEGAMIAKMRNMGEACTSANRFYVHEAVHDAFVEKFAAKMRALKLGNGLEEGVAVGPLVNAETRDKVAELVATIRRVA